MLVHLVQVTDRPSENETKAVVEKTKEVLLKRIDKHATNSQSKVAGVLPVPEYVKYMPSRLEEDIRPGGTCRLIKMHEVARDPLEPPRFRHKKVGNSCLFFFLVIESSFSQVPRGPGAPPVPVMHSPPRSASSEEQADWKIPPPISNWKACLLHCFTLFSYDP